MTVLFLSSTNLIIYRQVLICVSAAAATQHKSVMRLIKREGSILHKIQSI